MLNKATLIGNVGKDPEIRATKSGDKVATFSLATSERWKDKAGEKHEKTEWHNIVVYADGLVKLIEGYIEKGSKLYVEGKIQTRKWEDKEGATRYTTEIILTQFAGRIVMLSGKSDGEQGNGGSRRRGSKSEPEGDIDDDIPF